MAEVHDPIDVGNALDLIGRKREGRPPPVATCRRDDEPLVATFEFPGAEFYCVVCGALYGFLGPKPAEDTPQLAARLAELQQQYETEKQQRKEQTR